MPSDAKKSTFTTGQAIIWLGIICGNVETLLCIIYAGSNKFESVYYKKACIVFIILQPLWYLFLYILYVA